MQIHFTPTVVVYSERKKFYSACKTTDESVNDFVVRLKGLAAKCRFGTHFKDILKDKFVTTLDGRYFDKMCEEDESMDLEKAIQVALRVEGRLQLLDETQNRKDIFATII